MERSAKSSAQAAGQPSAQADTRAAVQPDASEAAAAARPSGKSPTHPKRRIAAAVAAIVVAAIAAVGIYAWTVAPDDMGAAGAGSDADAAASATPYESTFDAENSFSIPAEESIKPTGEEGAAFVNNELIVFAEDGTSPESVSDALATHGASVVGRIASMNAYQVRTDSTMTLEDVRALASTLADTGAIASAYPHLYVEMQDEGTTNDPCWTSDSDGDGASDKDANPTKSWTELDTWRGKGFTTTSNLSQFTRHWAYDAINLPEAWGVTTADANVTVGLVERGVYAGHEDLGIAIQYGDPVDTSHGTAVAGIIGARGNNGIGSAGVAYGCRLAVACFGSDEFKPSDENAQGASDYYNDTFGMLYAINRLAGQEHAKVINVSQGLVGKNKGVEASSTHAEYVKTYTDALKNLFKAHPQVLICVSAGDSGDDSAKTTNVLSMIGDEDVKSHILVVGASELDDNGNPVMADYSDGGSRVDVVAPGSYVWNSAHKAHGIQNAFHHIFPLLVHEPHDDYLYWSGTSMSAPIVSGIAALMWSANPGLPASEVKSIICATASQECSYAKPPEDSAGTKDSDTSKGSGDSKDSKARHDSTARYKIVNAAEAVKAAAALVEPEPATTGATEEPSTPANQTPWPVGSWEGTNSNGKYDLFTFAEDGTFEEWIDGECMTDASQPNIAPRWALSSDNNDEMYYSFLSSPTTATSYIGKKLDDDHMAIFSQAAPDIQVMTLTRVADGAASGQTSASPAPSTSASSAAETAGTGTANNDAASSATNVVFDTPYFTVNFPSEWGNPTVETYGENFVMPDGSTVERYYLLRSDNLGEWVCFVVYDPNAGQHCNQPDTQWVLDEVTKSGVHVAVGFSSETFGGIDPSRDFSSVNYAIRDSTTVK